jgi:sodium/proline symporter
MTRAGAFAGIFVGGLVAVFWKQLAGFGSFFQLYELVPGFVLSWVAIWLVSLATQPADRR